jgi:hypothetical protein
MPVILKGILYLSDSFVLEMSLELDRYNSPFLLFVDIENFYFKGEYYD